MPDNPLSPLLPSDAILDVASTRAMYLRRLRTLTDQLMASGVIARVRGSIILCMVDDRQIEPTDITLPIDCCIVY